MLCWPATGQAAECCWQLQDETEGASGEAAKPTVEQVEAEFWRVIEAPEQVRAMLLRAEMVTTVPAAGLRHPLQPNEPGLVGKPAIHAVRVCRPCEPFSVGFSGFRV